nr:uncharacterized mitochondrial protein AtMg00810-like [Tanacetum cinerariifolium]
SKAFRVFNSRTRIVEENFHIRFSESIPNVVGSEPDWLFDIDALTKIMNYEPIVADPKGSHNDGSKPSSDDGKKVDEETRKENEYNELLFDLNMLALENVGTFDCSSIDEDNGAVADMNNLDTTIQKELLQFKLQEVWTLVDLPDGKRAIDEFFGRTYNLLGVTSEAEEGWYLKGQLKLGLWYSKDSFFDFVAYTDCDYVGARLDRKSTTRELRKKLEKAKKERYEIKITLEKFENSSKTLNKMLDSQVNDKYKTGVGYHAVLPPYTGNFMPPKSNFILADMDEYVVSKTVTSVSAIAINEANTSESKPKFVSEPLIEDWVFDSEDENETETKSKQRQPSFS